jgi:hypothetical protein
MRLLGMLVGNMIGFAWLGSVVGDIGWDLFFPVLFLQLVGLFYGMTNEGGR